MRRAAALKSCPEVQRLADVILHNGILGPLLRNQLIGLEETDRISRRRDKVASWRNSHHRAALR